jgi:Fur family ferric uptake transcriptional regulator
LAILIAMAARAAALDARDEPASAALVEEALERLRASGARITTTRRLLLRCLFSGGSHRTAEDLAAEVQALAPDVHLSTIYRNLEELERLGIVVHAHLGHGPANYHLASEEHGHLVCEVCGATYEAPPNLFEDLGAQAMATYGFAIDPRHFAVLGRCANCAAR